jgi:hypothetical protein
VESVHDSSRTRGFKKVGHHGIRSRLSGPSSCDTGLRDRASLLALWLGDADTEALELDRHKRVLADGREDDYAETWGLLFDAGGDARANGVPFDEVRTQPWKEGWIAADINVGSARSED